jgi:predicted pyridoxine 5'-phosphate oxidase superfamily flavin-nucleotide-binding protein
MAQMSKEMIDMLEAVAFAILATATPDGIPNAVPIGAKKILDKETILLSDQFFNKTLTNMKANPRVSLTFWKDHGGYQIKGAVTIETKGRRYEETAKWIEEMGKKMGYPLKSKGAVILKVEEIYSIGAGPDAGKRLA